MVACARYVFIIRFISSGGQMVMMVVMLTSMTFGRMVLACSRWRGDLLAMPRPFIHTIEYMLSNPSGFAKKKPNLSWDHSILELGLGWTVNSTLDRPQINRQISETSWDQFLNLWFRSELPMNSKILDNDPGECGSTGNPMNGGLLVKPRSQRQASESRKPSYGFSNPWWIYDQLRANLK